MGTRVVLGLDSRDYLYAAGVAQVGRRDQHVAVAPLDRGGSAACRERRGLIGQKCELCGQTDGAVIGCSDCGIPFHASCAWLMGYKFGFEFSLVC